MSTDTTREKTMADYRESLILTLRIKDVPGERIGEIVAEVESHVADTGEDPSEAFGSPKAYAAHLTAERRREPWWRTALAVVPAGIAGWLIAQGTLALLQSETYHGQSGWLWLALGLAIVIPAAVRVHRRSNRVRDPRTGADMASTSRLGLVALVGLPIGLGVIAWGAIEIVGKLS